MSTPMGCRTCPGAAHDLFACLLREQRLRLEKAVVSHLYGPRETIFYAGTPALALYCVRSGSIKIYRYSTQGLGLTLGVRGPRSLLGLQSVVAGTPHACTAMTCEPSRICSIPSGTFLGLARDNPSMGYRLLQYLTREFQLLEEQLVERTHDRVAKRTARFLLEQIPGMEDGGSTPSRFVISMRREEMAQWIGTTPETLSRTLHRFALEGIVEVDRKEIRVLDTTSLLRLLE